MPAANIHSQTFKGRLFSLSLYTCNWVKSWSNERGASPLVLESSREDSLRGQDPQFASFFTWSITPTTCLLILLQQSPDPKWKLLSPHTPAPNLFLIPLSFENTKNKITPKCKYHTSFEMTAEIPSWQLKKSNYSFGNPFFLKAKSQANNIAYLNITKSQNSPLDLVLKGPFRRHPARKKKCKAFSKGENRWFGTSTLGKGGSAGGRIRCCWAASCKCRQWEWPDGTMG